MDKFKSKAEEERHNKQVKDRLARFNRRTHHYDTGKYETVQDKIQADDKMSMVKKTVHYNTE